VDSAFIDRCSEFYEHAVYALGEAHWREKVETFGYTQCGAVLDAGCGPGQWLRCLAKTNAVVVGIDIDAKLLGVAQRHTRSEENVVLVQGTIERLCFQERTFDAVLCYGVLTYVDYDAALDEMWRVLKPHGRIILGLPGYGYYLRHVIEGVKCNRVEAVRYGIEPIATRIGQTVLGRFSRSVRIWSGAAICRLLSRHGFAVTRLWADRLDPRWPASYLGAYFYYCVEARKRPSPVMQPEAKSG
jgi:SAM-dependent methyltransferase